MFQIVLSNRSESDIKKYSDSRRKLLELFIILRENPIPAEYYDVKKIEGRRDTYRVRLGDMRVIYEVDWSQRRIVIHQFLPRGRVYKGS
ncbi:MAG: type II toxin-antitoxin system RelE/ParE family toxin [Candidatus Bathyarchaeota archaeon]|nr:type II toxin-antitoxin system RelE/ParE family toxin [Candidatus Bathyarchaeota archaeon]